MGNTSQVIEKAISEALIKDETLSRSALYTKLSEVLKVSVEEVKTLLKADTITEEHKKSISETLGITVEAMGDVPAESCPVGEHMEGGKCVKDVAESVSEHKKLHESLDTVFGQTNDTTKKLDEIKKLIETNSKDDETKKFMNEVVRHIIEMVPLVASMNPKLDEIATLKTELKNLKEQFDQSNKTSSKLEMALNEAKALSKNAEKILVEQTKGKGRGLHHELSESVKSTATTGRTWDDLSLSEMIQKN